MNKIAAPDEPSTHVVHEAFGPPLSPRQAGSAIALGVVSLLISGLLPILLGALAEEHRLSNPGIGLSAMTEALTMALTTGLAASFLKPHRLRLIGVLAALALAAADTAVILAHSDVGVMAVRAVCGVPEGLMLWLTIGMIARTETPERWAGVLFTALTASQLAVSAVFATVVIPHFGASGGFAAYGLMTLIGVPVALGLPSRYVALTQQSGETGAPPPRGWIALLGTLIYVSAASAVAIYLVPLCVEAGLPPGVARLATSFSLAAQVAGGALATAAAGRINYFTVFVIGMLVAFGVYGVYGSTVPAWLFIAATALSGLSAIFVTPFLVPMTIEADPSRRAAVQSGAAQLLGAALGPLLASRVVSQHDAHGVLWLGAGLLATGLAIIAGLRFTRKAPLA